jgi:hypothetical protein
MMPDQDSAGAAATLVAETEPAAVKNSGDAYERHLAQRLIGRPTGGRLFEFLQLPT